MSEIFNLYGDKPVLTTGTHGIDVASQRIDDLDKASIVYAISGESSKTGIDLGCGLGVHSIRLALLGVKMHMFDLLDITYRIKPLKEILNLSDEQVIFHCKDIREESFKDIQTIDLVYSQRFIHYLPYSKAVVLVKSLYEHTNTGAKIFVSASGMTTELGNSYEGKNTPIEERFFFLQKNMAEKHSIKEKVCLYRMDELEKLFSQAGFYIEKSWLSAFGNVKLIARK